MVSCVVPTQSFDVLVSLRHMSSGVIPITTVCFVVLKVFQKNIRRNSASSPNKTLVVARCWHEHSRRDREGRWADMSAEARCWQCYQLWNFDSFLNPRIMSPVVWIMSRTGKLVIVLQLGHTSGSSVEEAEVGRWVVVGIVPVAELSVVPGGVLVVIYVLGQNSRGVLVGSLIKRVGHLAVGRVR